MTNVRGTALAGRIRYVERYHGENALDEVFDRLSDHEGAAKLRARALPHQWYPFELFIDLTGTIDRVCGAGDGTLARVMAGHVARDDLKTVYRIFFKLAAPLYIVGKAMSVWRQYYDSGEMVVHHKEIGRVEAELKDFATPHVLHCQSVCGWAEQYLTMAGGKQASVAHPSCRGDGDPTCDFVIQWIE